AAVDRQRVGELAVDGTTVGTMGARAGGEVVGQIDVGQGDRRVALGVDGAAEGAGAGGRVVADGQVAQAQVRVRGQGDGAALVALDAVAAGTVGQGQAVVAVNGERGRQAAGGFHVEQAEGVVAADGELVPVGVGDGGVLGDLLRVRQVDGPRQA